MNVRSGNASVSAARANRRTNRWNDELKAANLLNPRASGAIREAARLENFAGATDRPCRDRFRQVARHVRVLGAVVLAAVLLSRLPGLSTIAPHVESDYCYQLLAADRLYGGLGPTSLQPVAPNQPWAWSYDWGFLTQWPVGYSAIITTVRWLTGGTSLDAAGIVSIVSCAAAIVGWFLWLARSVPFGHARWIVASAGAVSGVPVTLLLNPSTDLIVVAALPWLMLLAIRLVQVDSPSERHQTWNALLGPCTLGLLAGGLFWIRYAALFVPAAIGLYLMVELWRRRVRLLALLAFGVFSAIPIAALILVNRMYGATASTTETFNLGARVTPEFSWSLLTETWSTFTRFGYYEHRPLVAFLLNLWPFIALGALVTMTRLGVRRSASDPDSYRSYGPIILSTCVVVTTLAMLFTATAIFGEKYHYVGLERYYLPVRPLYFALFIMPFLTLRSRFVRLVVVAVALATLNWTVQVDWSRAYRRAATDRIIASPYGQYVHSFGPDPTVLYDWLSERKHAGLAVVSNYHEYLALETGIATLPIPPNRNALDHWLARIGAARDVPALEVLFVLDPDNRGRSYWIPDPEIIRTDFELADPVKRFTHCDAIVYKYDRTNPNGDEIARH